MTTPAPDTGRAAEETMRADEALALRDELIAYAAQLIRMSTQAGLGGRDLSVRVKEPEHLAHLITRAASAIQARKWAAAEQEAATARKERDEALKLRKEDRAWYEMTVSVVEEQRENYRAEAAHLRAENARLLERIREAEKGAEDDLAPKSAPPLNRSETDGGRREGP